MLKLTEDKLYHWTLKGHEPVPCTLMEWAEWFEQKGDHRRVALDKKYGIIVSTVFLGLDHNWGGGPPLLFETMIFGGRHDDYQERYSTWDEAVEGHKKACALAFPTGFFGWCELFAGAIWRSVSWVVERYIKEVKRAWLRVWEGMRGEKKKK
jgi:hypothetical protein